MTKMRPKHYQCTMCYRLSPVWGKPTSPYVCPLCKAAKKITVTQPPEKQWRIQSTLKVAEELSVQLEIDETGRKVREVGHESYDSWLTMYGRLYQRKRYHKKGR